MALMWNAATVAFNADYPTHRDRVFGVEDILTWTPPPFKCPKKFHPVVCAYTEPIVRLVATAVYCDVGYGRDWEACDGDKICTVVEGNTRRCSFAEEEIERSYSEARNVYIDAIHDPYLRDVVSTAFNCSKTGSISKCDRGSSTAALNLLHLPSCVRQLCMV